MKATGLDALFDATIKEMKEAGDNTIVFTNFVDFDSSLGGTVATSQVMRRVWNCSTAVCQS